MVCWKIWGFWNSFSYKIVLKTPKISWGTPYSWARTQEPNCPRDPIVQELSCPNAPMPAIVLLQFENLPLHCCSLRDSYRLVMAVSANEEVIALTAVTKNSRAERPKCPRTQEHKCPRAPDTQLFRSPVAQMHQRYKHLEQVNVLFIYWGWQLAFSWKGMVFSGIQNRALRSQ
jgi:hypothetical protein